MICTIFVWKYDNFLSLLLDDDAVIEFLSCRDFPLCFCRKLLLDEESLKVVSECRLFTSLVGEIWNSWNKKHIHHLTSKKTLHICLKLIRVTFVQQKKESKNQWWLCLRIRIVFLVFLLEVSRILMSCNSLNESA